MDQTNFAWKPNSDDVGIQPVGSVNVHQATGMIMAQTGASPGDAFRQLKDHAIGVGLSLEVVSRQVVARVISFEAEEIDRGNG